MIGVATPASFDAWRDTARRLLAAEVAPDGVMWTGAGLFGETILPETAQPLRVPRAFVSFADEVAAHRDPERWALLYRLLWRVTHGEAHVLQLETDDDMVRATVMAKAVWRDLHKMKAFVRFRVVKEADGVEHYIAWHRPDHFIVPRVAPFFVERFYAMRWSILTPDASAFWRDEVLSFGPGAPREAAPSDDVLEDLWRDYYASIYNPARTNLALMQQHVPKKHWATLPELRDFRALVEKAQPRVAEMITHTTKEKRSAAPFVPAQATHAPHTHASLSAAAAACQGCDLFKSATQTVFGEGPVSARIMCVGEQPGDQEDVAGTPFIGPAGEVLARALAEAGIARDAIYVTNAVKHFKWTPRGKRRLHQKPNVSEIKACQPWLEAELALVKPHVLVCLGATAAQAVLGQHVQVNALRGQRVHTSRAPFCVVTFHPSAVLRSEDGPATYAALVEDLRAALAMADSAGAAPLSP